MITSFFATLFLLLTSLFGFGSAPTADAAPADVFSGYAWSPNVGWISFNCTDNSPTCSAGTNYGVTMTGAGTTKTMSGYAWSSNLGWITFNAAELTGCPSGTCSATVNTNNGQISGWARACFVFVADCSGAMRTAGDTGGWDGWISLRHTDHYGVLVNGDTLTGYAWGGGSVTGSLSPYVGGTAVPGWISFRGTTTQDVAQMYGVSLAGAGVGARIIACGVDKSEALLNESVTWTVVYDDTKISPAPTFTWYTLSEAFSPLTPVTNATKNSSYSIEGVKKAMVRVTTATGQIYDVDCDGSAVPGKTDPGHPQVSVSDRDINFDSVTVPSVPETGTVLNVTGQFDFSGLSTSAAVTARFEFDTDGNNTSEQSATVVVSGIGEDEQDRLVTAPWTPGAALTTYRIRLCVDPSDLDVLNETDDTNADNCTPWSSTFEVTSPVSAPGGVCVVQPRITTIGGKVTWDSTASGGDNNYTYSWTFTPAPKSFIENTSAASADPKVTYDTIGIKSASVTITSASLSSGPQNCSGNVRVQKVEDR